MARPANAITLLGVDLPQLVQNVYDLSRPQGLGHFEYVEGDQLTRAEAEALIASVVNDRVVVRLDYVRGRACKFTVFADPEDGTPWLRGDLWYDHDDATFDALLARHNLSRPPA